MKTTLPLQGVRVADFTWVWAGPFCTLQLAHLGAEVIRVESESRLCVTRRIPPYADQKEGPNRSGYYNQYNQGKSSICLDLKKPEGLEIAKRLVAASDVVAENFAAGVMDKMGLGYDVLKGVKPEVIMIALSGYGATGPESPYVSYGPAQVPMSGLASMTGFPDSPPMSVGFSYGDPNGGLHGAFAVLAALMHRTRTGEGQYIDLSQWETSVALVGEGIMAQQMKGEPPARIGNRDPHMAPHGLFRCEGEDRWVSIAVASDAEWTKFCAVMKDGELDADVRFSDLRGRKTHEDALEAKVTEWTTTMSSEEATHRLQDAGIAAFPALTNREIAEDPHMLGRKYFSELEHPEVGTRQHAGIPWKFSETPCEVRRPAPCLGQDSEDVLRDVLGYSPDEIAAFKGASILS